MRCAVPRSAAAACPVVHSASGCRRETAHAPAPRPASAINRKEGRLAVAVAAFNGDDADDTGITDIDSSVFPSPSSAAATAASAAAVALRFSSSHVQESLNSGALLFEGRALLLELSEMFTASELQIARGEELAFVHRAFPLLQRWGEYAGSLAELDEEEGERRERERTEGGGGGGGGGRGRSSPPPALLPSELLWRDLRATFPDSLTDFPTLSDFHSGVLAWSRVLEEDTRATLGAGAGAAIGSSGENEGEGGGAPPLEASRSSSSSSPSSLSYSRLTDSLVSAARASRDHGVRSRVKAALRVRMKEENDGNEDGSAKEEQQQPPPPTPPPATLAWPSRPEQAPKLARAAWRDPRALLVLYALSAISELPERAHGEALATLLLKKLSNLPPRRRP